MRAGDRNAVIRNAKKASAEMDYGLEKYKKTRKRWLSTVENGRESSFFECIKKGCIKKI